MHVKGPAAGAKPSNRAAACPQGPLSWRKVPRNPKCFIISEGTDPDVKSSGKGIGVKRKSDYAGMYKRNLPLKGKRSSTPFYLSVKRRSGSVKLSTDGGSAAEALEPNWEQKRSANASAF